MSEVKLLLSLVILTVVIGIVLVSCTTRYDPAPKWTGYQLEFRDGPK